mgnify:FL=1
MDDSNRVTVVSRQPGTQARGRASREKMLRAATELLA